MGKTRACPKLPRDISFGGILGRNAFGVDRNSKSLRFLIIQYSVFIPIIRFAGQCDQRTVAG